MQPIPAFNPGDTVAYPNGNGVINVGAADAGAKMLLYNESPFNINIDFLNGSQSILHAWEARYWTLDGDTRQVEWDINSTLNVSNSPISLVIGELYNAGERLEGTYPMGLIRQTNVGNTGGIATTSTNQVINDGNTLQEVIEATLSGHASSDVIINNDGSFTLKGAGLLAAIGVLTHILGDLQVDGNLNSAFTISVNNVHGQFKAVPTGGLYFVDSGNNVRIAIDTDNTFIEAGTGNVQLQAPAGTTQITVDPTGITLAEAVQVNAATNLGDTVNKQGATVHGTLVANNALTVNGTTGITNAGPINMANNKAITSKDSLGAAQTMLTMDGTNKTHVGSGAVGAEVRFDDSAGTQMGWFNSGGGGNVNGTFQSPTFALTVGGGGNFAGFAGTLSRFTFFTGTGSGTYSHSQGVSPQWVGPIVNVAGSATQGFDSKTSTQVHITLGATLGFTAMVMNS